MKSKRRVLGAMLAAGCVLAVMVGCTGGNSNTGDDRPSDQGGLLMVQEAQSGELREHGGPGEYTLTLRDPSRFVTVFTDRPQRRAYQIDARRFVRSWNTYGFEQDPPNVALEVPDAPPGRDLMIVELSDPVLDGSGTITYTARQGIEQRTHAAAFVRPADDLAAAPFEHPTLFIDSGSPNPDAWTQACERSRGRSDTGSYIWHCRFPDKFKANDARQRMAQACPGSFNYNQAEDIFCIT